MTPKQLLTLFIIFSMLLACDTATEKDNRLLGTWRLQRSKGIHTILSFRNNGSFEVDQRIEGRLSKIVEKRGKATGTWEMDDAGSRLTLITSQGDANIGWPARTVAYDIVTFDPRTLHLMDPGGKHDIWKKIRRSKTNQSEGKTEAVYKIAPLVVNLARSNVRAHQRYEWICTEVDITLDGYDVTARVHPSVREKTIFFLNAKTYGEINTQSKLATAALELKDILNPYLDDHISKILFNNTVLTGQKKVLDEFMAKYAIPEKKPPNKGRENKGD